MVSTKSCGFQFNQLDMNMKVHEINQRQLGQYPEHVTIRHFDKTYQYSKKIITKDSCVSVFKFVTSKGLFLRVHPLLHPHISQQN